MLPHLRQRRRRLHEPPVTPGLNRASADALDAALVELEAGQAEVEETLADLESQWAALSARLSAFAGRVPVGASEIAERLGLADAKTVHALRTRCDDFPAPVAQLRMGYLWAWPDVEEWARATGRI